MDTSRIQGPTTPLERVNSTHDGRNSGSDEEKAKFELGEKEREPSGSDEERERGEVAPRSDDESGGRLDLTA
ncbi:MAG: hypothetical protein OSB14_08095 [Planctomycetota bacterium]|nr:hypothetical protein [Planctomycetota bacterium]